MDEYYEDDDYSLDDNNFNVGISKEQILNFFILFIFLLFYIQFLY